MSVRPYRPAVKPAMMSLDEIAKHNERVRRASAVRALLPPRPAMGDAWAFTGRRRANADGHDVLDWCTGVHPVSLGAYLGVIG